MVWYVKCHLEKSWNRWSRESSKENINKQLEIENTDLLNCESVPIWGKDRCFVVVVFYIKIFVADSLVTLW
jgi:hypothetical protein